MSVDSAARAAAGVPGEELAPLVPNLPTQEDERAGTSRPAAAAAYLQLFVLVVSIGGLLFGFDTGVISGALPYIRDDLLQQYAGDPMLLANWQEIIVSAAIVAAGVGSVIGGWLADRMGRKSTLMLADVLFTAGALGMAAASNEYWLVAGRALVGLGVGLASVAVPIFIAECAPPAQRASLVTFNVLLITGGQLLAYMADYLFSFVPGTWRWMLGVAALPSLLQLVGLAMLPESPRWLASKGRMQAAHHAAQKLGYASLVPTRPAMPTASITIDNDSGSGGDAAGTTVATAAAQHIPSFSGSGSGMPWRMLLSRLVLRQLHVGVGLQVLQQVAGINTVMYYTPTILQLAGLSNQAALLLAMVPAATNALGTVVGMRCIDRYGRRRLLLTSIAAVVVALAMLGSAFLAAERHSPQVLLDSGSTGSGGSTSTCPALVPDCTACLRHGCGFCGGDAVDGAAGGLMAPGLCLSLISPPPPLPTPPTPEQQPEQASESGSCSPPHQLFLHGCPSRYTPLILACLIAYLAAFSPGLGPVPWAVNSEIYPLGVRGVATGMAATANWISNAAVAQTFLTLTRLLGGSGAFYLYAGIACCGFMWTYAFLPETNGLTLEQVQQLFSGEGSSGISRSSNGGGGGGLLWDGRQQHKQHGSDDEASGPASA